MYRLMILEDEIWISTLIQTFVKQHFHDRISIIKCCQNGLDAFKTIVDEKPDIALVDINVPLLSGLDVILRTKEQHCNCQFVIITGYKDFDYARQALKAGVSDYLLKPVDEEELCSILNRIIRKLEKEQNDRTTLEQNSYLLKIHFLKQVILQSPVSDNRQIDCSQYGFHFEGDFYSCMVLKCMHQQMPHIRSDTLESLLIEAESLADTIYSHICHDYFCFQQGTLIILVLNLRSEVRHQFYVCCEEFFQNLLSHAKEKTLHLSAGIGSIHSLGLYGLNQSSQEAIHALHSRIRLGANRAIRYGKDTDYKPTDYDSYISDTQRHELARCISAQDITGLTRWYRHIVEAFLTSAAVNENETLPILPLLDKIVEYFCQEIDKLNVITTKKTHILDKLDMCSSITDLCANVIGQLQELLEDIREQLSKNKTNVSIRMACQYINEHLADTLTLEIVASQVYLNSTYLSELFKSETGQNFKDYILEKRMELACELLKSPMKITEVAVRAGYPDAKRFSKSFKKFKGISPKEYQRIYT